MFDQIIRGFLWIHIASGFTAFFVAPVALLTRKGSDIHRRWGRIYFWAMTSATLTSMVVAAYRPNLFLFLIGVFSFYFAFSGYRALLRQRLNGKRRAAMLDWSVAAIALLASLSMIVWGSGLLSPERLRLNLVLMVFGTVGVLTAGFDLVKFWHPSTNKNAWFIDHMSGMVASYIAAVSAFAVVNLTFLPPLVRWLGPTAIGAPLLVFWVNHYRRQFRLGKRPVEVAVLKDRLLVHETA